MTAEAKTRAKSVHRRWQGTRVRSVRYPVLVVLAELLVRERLEARVGRRPRLAEEEEREEDEEEGAAVGDCGFAGQLCKEAWGRRTRGSKVSRSRRKNSGRLKEH